MYKKKAEVVVSFSWLFMAIIGVFFIALAYNIVMQFQETEEEKFRVELQQNLRSILNTVGRTSGLEENLVEPLGNLFRDSDVELTCFENIPIMSINGYEFAENSFVRNNPTALSYISQGRLDNTYLAVESFRLPFKTTNILAFVSEYNLIVFDEGSNISEEFEQKFKQQSAYRDFSVTFEYSFDDMGSFIQDMDGRALSSVMFVSDEGVTLSNLDLEDLNYDAYHVQIDYTNVENMGGYSEITFADSNKENQVLDSYESIDYDNSLTLETLAIFSNSQAFSCSYDVLLENTKISYDFYLKKLSDIIDRISDVAPDSNSEFCSSTVNSETSKIYYENLNESLFNLKEEINQNNFTNPNEILTLLNTLETSYMTLENRNCYDIY